MSDQQVYRRLSTSSKKPSSFLKLIIKRCRDCPYVYIDAFSSCDDRCNKSRKLLRINNLNKIPENCPLPKVKP